MAETARLPLQDWMTAPETRAVVDAVTAGGAPARFVGGCVRDALAGRPVRDIDLATPEPPERVMELLRAAGLKAVPTGLDHGTVTAVSGHRPFEITTLRHDVETFGRRAKVAFTDDWEADAARRDFTFNALSCTPEGELHDYFGGRADLLAGRVRFVGKARRRIAEDYLRLLRFFRFHAFFGRGAPDPDGLAAAAAAAPKLAELSPERVRAELFRLLQAPDPVPVLDVMLGHAILAAELPEAASTQTLRNWLALEAPPSGAQAPDPLPRFAALLEPSADALEIAKRLRLSNAERDRLAGLLRPTPPLDPGMTPKALRAALYRLGRQQLEDGFRLAAARAGRGEGLVQALSQALAAVAAWHPSAFPVKGRDLRALGMAPGAEMGRLLAELEAWWIAEDFRPDRAALLARARRNSSKES
jgi:poly(A) polymerase